MKGLVRLAGLILPHWKRAVLGLFLSLVTLLANVGLLALSSWFIATMAVAGLAGAVIDYTLPATGVRALAVLRSAGRYAERLVNHDTTFRILGSLRLWFYRRIGPLAPARLASYRSGDLLSRIRSDIDCLDDFYVRGLVPALVAALALACILPFLASYDARIAWIDGLALTAAGLVFPIFLSGLAAQPGRESVLASAELRTAIVEELEGMAELVALGAARDHALGLDRAAATLDARQRRLNSLQGLGEATIVAASSLAVWGTALVVVALVNSGSLPGPDLAMLSVCVLATFETIMPLPAAIQKAGEMSAAAGRLFELIDAVPAVEDPAIETATTPLPRPGQTVDLRIDSLVFRYAPALPPVFENFSLDLPGGSKLGLVGPSGCGKSSLLNLLLRFWDYQAGRIELGGRNLREYPLETVRSFFTVLPQTPFLYHASIRDNLLLALHPEGETVAEGGVRGAEVRAEDEELLRSALEAARLGELIAALPEGLDGIVGETGRAVSVGEAQRLALARVFLKEAPIMLLDEPTEGLDDRTADAVLAAIATRARDKTLILISHRERDLGIVDRVCRLGGG